MLLQEAIIQYSIVNCGSLTPYPRTLWRQPTLRSRQRPCYWGMEGGRGGQAKSILNSQLWILDPYPRTLGFDKYHPWALVKDHVTGGEGRGGANPILNSQLLVLYPHPRTLWTPPPLSPQRPFWGEGRILLDMVYVCPGGDCTGIAIFLKHPNEHTHLSWLLGSSRVVKYSTWWRLFIELVWLVGVDGQIIPRLLRRLEHLRY